jgi:hypothetical protein
MESCGHYQRWKEDFGLVQEMGMDRKILPVGEAYKQLISEWRNLPTQSLCLTVPVVLPDEVSDHHARRQMQRAASMIKANPSVPAL